MLNKRLRSYVCHGRATPGQKRAYDQYWPSVGINDISGLFDFEKIFGRKAPCFLEIGFGSGQSLAALAKNHPEQDFLGVEIHKPGIGALCLAIEQHELANLRIYHGDVVDLLANHIPDLSLAGIQIFFPDPWPKRRQHARRLIQPDFLQQIVKKLKVGAQLHVATDWEDYAIHILKVLSQEPVLQPISQERSQRRPLVTKFEKRALEAGRQIRDFQFTKV